MESQTADHLLRHFKTKHPRAKRAATEGVQIGSEGKFKINWMWE